MASLGELAATFLLEVLGGAGAVWGSSEFMGVRRGNNASMWRLVSGLVGLWCLARWVKLQVLRRPKHASDEVLATFLLQVLGGAGAVWGCLEIAGYRVHYPTECKGEGVGGAWAPGYSKCRNTYPQCRVITVVAGAAFLIRWRWLQDARGDPEPPRRRAGSSGAPRRAFAVPELLALFVLDVCGGAGALWGAAEVCYLRAGWGDDRYGQPSFDFWRHWCAAAFMLCLARFGVRESYPPPPPPDAGARTSSTELTAGACAC